MRLGQQNKETDMALLMDSSPRLTGTTAQEAASPSRATLQQRLRRAKSAYTTRRVDLSSADLLITAGRAPRAGDLVLARVSEIGQHARLELRDGRRARLHPGDEVVVCYGARYAPDQFESVLPEDLGGCDLVAAGGVASRMLCRHRRMRAPTALEPVGLLAGADGEPLNIACWSLPTRRCAEGARPPVLAVLGTSMNSGKTTTAESLVRGFGQRGLEVAAAKVTGTGAGGDRWCVKDAGAHPVLDFTDAGVPSTFGLDLPALERVMHTLVATLADGSPDVIVLEVADGLCQRETAALLRGDAFRELVDGIVFAAGEALGARAGVEELARIGCPVLAVSGLITASPLASREAASVTGLPVAPNADIAAGVWLPDLAALAPGRRQRAAA
jgi:hypothetical protein